jgi:ketosteroid isomerase-like protein
MGKRLFIASAAVCVALFSGFSMSQDLSAAATVKALEFKLLDCYKHHEVQVFASVLDDDFVITFEDGSTYSKTGYLAYSTSSGTRVELAEISEMRVRLHGDTAVVTGIYHEKGLDSQKSYDYHDRFTDVWMKKAGKWQLIAAHYSVPSK